MPIYLLFLQHIIYSLSSIGRAAVVVPTGFLTEKNGIAPKIRKKIVDTGIFQGAISMPSNIFATTGTNVSILFLDASSNLNQFLLIDASNLGETVKEGKNQKTLLSQEEEDLIVNTFRNSTESPDFSVLVSQEELIEKNYSFNSGQYFKIPISHQKLSPNEFDNILNDFKSDLAVFSKLNTDIDQKIANNLLKLRYKK
jgi:type I restriction enzyme M protein